MLALMSLVAFRTVEASELASGFWLMEKSLLRKVSAGKRSLTLDCPLCAVIMSFMSNMYNPLGLSFNGTAASRRGLVKTCRLLSMLALRVLTNVLESNSGVSPGTMATLSPSPIEFKGITNACALSNVPWFPKRKVISHLVRLNWRCTSFGKLSIRASKCLLPITDFVAPVSKMPRAPWAVKNATSSAAASWFGCIRTGLAGRTSVLGIECFVLLVLRTVTPLALLRIRSQTSWETSWTTLITCKLGTSSEVSWTTGSWINSIGIA